MKKLLLGVAAAMLPAMAMYADAPELSYSFSPADGTTVTSISQFTFTVNGVDPTPREDGEMTDFDFRRDGTPLSYANFSSYPRFQTGKIVFPEGLTTDGVYTFHFDEGAYVVTIDDVEYPCPAVDYTLTVGDPNGALIADVTYTVTPGNGANVEAPVAGFSVNFNTTDEITFTENASTLLACNVEYNGTTLSYATDFSEGDEITDFLFEEPLTEEGLVKVNIPEGFYLIGGKKSPAISWSFMIGEESVELPDVTWTLSPANGAVVGEAVSQLQVKFDTTVEKVAFGEGYGKYSYIVYINGASKYAPNSFTFDANDPSIINFVEPIDYDATVKVAIDPAFYELTRTNGEKVEFEGIEYDGWNFTVKMPVVLPAVKRTFEPANGAVVTEPVSQIQIKFDDTVESVAKGPEFGKYACIIYINGYGKYYPNSFNFDENDMSIIKFAEPIDYDAEVKVVMDAGFYTLTRTNGDKVDSDGITAENWTFKVAPKPAVTVDYTVAPMNNSTLEGPVNSVSVTFDTTEDISFSDDMSTLMGYTVTYNGKTLSYATDFFEGDEITEMVFEEPLTEAGVVTVNIPAGFYMIGETASPAIRWSFTIKGEEKSFYTVTPAPGSEVSSMEELTTITIAVPEGYTFTGYNWMLPTQLMYFEDANGNRTSIGNFQYDKFTNGEATVLTYTMKNYDASKEYAYGKYVLVIKKGGFSIFKDGSASQCELQEYTFYLVEPKTPVADVTFTLTPAADATVESPVESISVKFDTEEEISFSNDVNVLMAYTVEYNGQTLSYASDFFEGNDEITEMVFDTPLTEAGVVTVTIPEGFYMIGNELSPAITWSFTIEKEEASLFTFSPASGSVLSSMADLQTVTVTVADGLTFTGNQAGWLQPGRYLYFEDENGERETQQNASMYYKYDSFTNGVSNEIIYRAQNYNSEKTYADGKYVLVFPAGSFSSYDGTTATRCEPIELVYYIKSEVVAVEEVANDSNFTVYTMTGIRVAENADAAALKQLAKGLYIVNGKKVSVK